MKNMDCLFQNNNHDITYATGIVRPKTTALFFDKLWIPHDRSFLIRFYGDVYNDVPEDICFNELDLYKKKNYVTIKGTFHHARTCMLINAIIKDNYIFKPMMSKTDTIVPNITNDYNSFCDCYNLENEHFKYSLHRNDSLERAVVYFKKHYGINVTPIFAEKTEFERGMLYSNADELSTPKVSVIEASIKAIPMIIEENLSWQQVKDIRNDKKSIAKIRRLKNWAIENLKGKSQEEVIDIICTEIDDYVFALKKHGVLTAVGGFTTILSGASTIISAFEGAQPSLLAAGLTISVGVIAYSAEQISSYIDVKRTPVAFIYDISKKMNK